MAADCRACGAGRPRCERGRLARGRARVAVRRWLAGVGPVVALHQHARLRRHAVLAGRARGVRPRRPARAVLRRRIGPVRALSPWPAGGDIRGRADVGRLLAARRTCARGVLHRLSVDRLGLRACGGPARGLGALGRRVRHQRARRGRCLHARRGLAARRPAESAHIARPRRGNCPRDGFAYGAAEPIHAACGNA